MVQAAQPEAGLFDLGDIAGVFLFPDPEGLPADKVTSLETTKRRLSLILELMVDSKFKGSDAFKVSDSLRWLLDFQARIEEELLKLKMLMPAPETNGRING
jgi:hypothetical protein